MVDHTPADETVIRQPASREMADAAAMISNGRDPWRAEKNPDLSTELETANNAKIQPPYDALLRSLLEGSYD